MRILGKIFRYFPFSVKCKFVDILLKKDGIEIKEAKTQEELEQVYRLRFKVYKDEDYIEPQDYPEQTMKDNYDNYSISFLSVKNKEPIGALRMIKYSQFGFPTEKAFNILKFPFVFSKEDAINLSKLCVKKEFRNGITSLGLIKKAFEYSKKENIRYWIFDTTQDLVHYFEDRLGISIPPLPVGTPGPTQFEERKAIAKKYFQRFELHPYIVKLEEVKKT